jgi:hypothetical protein
MLFEGASAPNSGLVERGLDHLRKHAIQILECLQRWLCALEGHNLLLHFESNRLSLRCANCGWDTPGWTIATRTRPQASLTRRSQEPRNLRSTPVLIRGGVRSRTKYPSAVAQFAR